MALIVAGALLIVVWRLLPRFWQTLGIGALAGLIAGVLVLGPGFRLAMRVVAIADPVRVPEFTVDGTFFVMLFVGGILGVFGGVSYAFLDRGLDQSRRVISVVVSSFLVGLLLFSDGLREELLELGAGAWMNIPMFWLVAFLYASFAGWLVARFEGRWVEQESTEPAEVRA